MKFIVIICSILMCLKIIVAREEEPIHFITSASDVEYLKNNNISWNFEAACEPYYDVQDMILDPNDEQEKIHEMVANNWHFIYYKLIRENSEYMFCKSIKNAEYTELTQEIELKPGSDTFLLGIVVSNTIKNNKRDLYNYVDSIWYQKVGKENKLGSRNNCLGYTEENNNLKTILICSKYDKEHVCDIQDYLKDVDIKFSTNCKDDIEVYYNNLFAVLADEPFEVDKEMTVPVIFFDYPYMRPETKSMIPNSVNLIEPWWLLKYGFLDVLRAMRWSRVAVLSDDSPYSIEFKDKLVDLFKKENISFTTRGCHEQKYCNQQTINEALDSLEKVHARIVIANVEEKYKDMLDAHHIRFTWLTRGWSFTKQDQEDQSHPSISLKLGPVFNDNDHEVEVNYECRGIFEGLEKILRIKKTLEDDNSNNIKRNDYFRKFINLFSETIERSKASLFLKVVYGYDKEDKITYNSINEKAHGVELMFPSTPDRPSCVFKRDVYEHPCEETGTILNIMLVVIMFFVTMLLIFCFFQEPPHSSYQSMD